MKLFRVKMLHTVDQLFAGDSYNVTRDRADVLIERGDAEREGPGWDHVVAPIVPEPTAPVIENPPTVTEQPKAKAPVKRVLHMPKRAAAKQHPKVMPKSKAR